ncbi:MAG TPA: dihydroxyacetone kinase subunit DhaK, partial [Candidatus Methylacidiphilales bacterium]
VESVLIDDDVAVKDSTWTAGRRGVGATVLAEKIAGAAAEAGRSLAEVAAIARRVNAQARSMGIALTSCTVPHAGKPTFVLPEDEMEVGVGIHGEPGRERTKLRPADEIVSMLLDPILSDLPFRAGDEVLLFVNGLGGTPLLELYLAHGKADALLRQAGIQVVRHLVGPYITSLEMAGASITLLKLDPELAAYWDAPVKTPGLRWGA